MKGEEKVGVHFKKFEEGRKAGFLFEGGGEGWGSPKKGGEGRGSF